MLKIQETFAALLRQTAVFFTAEDQDSTRDHKEIENLRQGALEFVKEIQQPSTDRFLAHLLSVSSVESHYPLHCIRMAALVTRTLSQEPAVTPGEVEKLATAAFFSDIGFRVAWLGSKGNHREVAAYHMKDMGFSWFTPDFGKLILGHHTVTADTSPFKILSLISRYLALTQGAGIDQSPAQLLTPTQALGVLIQESGDRHEAMKLLVKVLSAYPIGSWVELSSGQIGFVLGANAQAPMRPRIGLPRSAVPPQGVVSAEAIEEHDLSRERALQITRERVPGPLQQILMDNPSCWLPGWQGGIALGAEEIRRAFDPESAGPPSEGLADHAAAIEEFWMDRKVRPVSTVSTAEVKSTEVKSQKALDVQMDELQSLRADWEKRVQMAEEMVGKLKMGLLESYKRENDKYKNLLDKLAQPPIVLPPAPGISADKSAAPSTNEGPLDPAEESLVYLQEEIERTLQSGGKQLRRIQEEIRVERNAIQELFSAARGTVRFLHTLYTDHNAELGAAHDSLTEIMERWEAQLERLESTVFQTPTFPRSVTEYEFEETAGRSTIEELSRKGARPSSPEAVKKVAVRWTGVQAPELQKRLSTAQKELVDFLHALTGPRNMIEHLKAEGDRLKSVLLSKIVLSYLARGIARREVSDNAAATAYFKKAIELKPDFWQAHAFLGLCYLSGKDDRAMAEFKAAVAVNPGHKDLEACLGLAAGPAKKGI